MWSPLPTGRLGKYKHPATEARTVAQELRSLAELLAARDVIDAGAAPDSCS